MILANWITPYFEAWREAYDGEMAVGKNAQALKRLEARHGPAEVLKRWKVMLRRTKPQFANAHVLAQGWGTFAGEAAGLPSSGAPQSSAPS